MSYEVTLIKQGELARFYRQDLARMRGAPLNWLDWDILRRWRDFLLGAADGS